MSETSGRTGIRIGIITVREDTYHPNRRLLEAASQAGCQGMLIHPYRVWPTIEGNRLGLVGEHAHRLPQVVLPRQGAEIGDTCLALIHHLQHMGITLVNDHQAVSITRNKFLTQQKLCAADLPCPATVFINDKLGFQPAVDYLGGYPVVVKPVSARQGEGVMLVKNEDDATSRVLPTLDRQQGLMVQRYLPPDGRRDIRILVVGGEAICAASLTPQKGEFRANFHLGGDIRAIDLSADLVEPAVAAAAVVGCDVAGVDMMVGRDGLPQIIEVNYSPGFRGMEAASGLDVARRMIDLSIKKYQKK